MEEQAKRFLEESIKRLSDRRTMQDFDLNSLAQLAAEIKNSADFLLDCAKYIKQAPLVSMSHLSKDEIDLIREVFPWALGTIAWVALMWAARK